MKSTEFSPAVSKTIDDLAALVKEGRSDAALLGLRKMHQAYPKHPGIAFNLGRACHDLHLDDEALAAYSVTTRYADRRERCYRQAIINSGVCFEYKNNYRRAIRMYKRALDLEEDPYLWETIGILHHSLSESEPSLAALLRAIHCKSDYGSGYFNTADVFFALGEIEKAVEWGRRGLEVTPNHHLGHSNMLFVLNHSDKIDNLGLLNESRKWGEKHADAVPKVTGGPYKHDKIRIAYLSGDFKRHVVSGNFWPVFKEHNKERFETYCYSMVPKQQEDTMTEKIHDTTDHWLDICQLTDAEVVKSMLDAEIDILVDLTGHTALNRTKVIAAKPAPIQVNWIGWVNTTGMAEVDYRLTDPLCDPEGMSDPYYVEKILRVPNSCCYSPIPEAPPVKLEPPCLKNGFVTFGSSNTLSKMNPSTIKLWSEVLNAIPSSRLLLKARWLKDKAARKMINDKFHAQGVDTKRLIMRSWDDYVSTDHYLKFYEDVDVCLDPLAFNGGITTWESLLQGVPVVSLIGDRMTARMGLRLLTLAGLSECLAHSKEHYITVASTLASAPDHLIELRKTMRDRLQASPLMDGKTICKNIETEYERILK